MRHTLILASSLAAVLAVSAAQAQPTEPGDAEAALDTSPRAVEPAPVAAVNIPVDITEWPVPWESSRPRDPDVAPNGTIWLVGQGGDYVAHFDPDTEEFSKFDLPPGTGPHTVVVDRDASLWIAGNRQAYIGKMNPNSGEMVRYTMPDDAVKDPHTMVFDSGAYLWFTAQWSNVIGRLDKRNGSIETIDVPIDRARPYGIKLDSAGNPWIALLGTNALARVDAKTLELEVIRTPREASRLRRLAITSDDRVWYTDYSEGWLGSYDPATGAFVEYRNPSEQSGPYAIEVDAQDRVWQVETHPDVDQFVGFDPESETFFSITPIPSGAGAVRHMVFDPERNAIWFGTDTNNLGQAILP
ncbi:Vgb family protein [Marinihelvus fidelis]|uniref:Vgb family protein n=1 Tax=Marinihelvus fidelis TaxID=2613842 RepID=UPI001CD7887A|nr:lyase [Marinihelvus fidelis]